MHQKHPPANVAIAVGPGPAVRAGTEGAPVWALVSKAASASTPARAASRKTSEAHGRRMMYLLAEKSSTPEFRGKRELWHPGGSMARPFPSPVLARLCACLALLVLPGL